MSVSTYEDTILTVLLRRYTKYNVHSEIVRVTEEKEQQTWVNEVEDTNKTHRRKKYKDVHLFCNI
jgi:hypothetical protein